MDLLHCYGEDSDAEPADPEGYAKLNTSLQISAAPDVETSGLVRYNDRVVSAGDTRLFPASSARQVMYNLPFEDLHAPIVGPAHPYQKDGIAAGLKNHTTGFVEDTHMNPYVFDEQYNTFHSFGFSQAPSGDGVVGDKERFAAMGGSTVFTAAKRQRMTAEKKEAKLRREQLIASTVPGQPFSLTDKLPWINREVKLPELTEEQREYMAKMEAEKAETSGLAPEAKGPTSFFHGKEKEDYQGRSWMAAPKDKRKESDTCFLPKRWVHTWSGHTKGVNAIRFFPGCGHLMLSAGMDGKVKIWDVFNGGKCMRTYLGHTKGVRDITFSNDGRRFISTGYDKQVHVWDTETGSVIRTFSTGKIYYCVKLHPDDSKQNVLMGGCSDKKIYQWDIDSGDLVQEYNYHLGPVNTVTFVDEGRRFVSTSDDKTIRIWEFGIPVQIKYIADPSMHSIPAVGMHPSGNFLLGQSLDNQVVTYACKDKFKLNRKKTFKGHNTAGYACQVSMSPDGKYVLSGDSEGRVFFWEWAAPFKVVRTIKAHDAVCIGVAWHPMESSRVATCGWDGLIKYWD